MNLEDILHSLQDMDDNFHNQSTEGGAIRIDYDKNIFSEKIVSSFDFSPPVNMWLQRCGHLGLGIWYEGDNICTEPCCIKKAVTHC